MLNQDMYRYSKEKQTSNELPDVISDSEISITGSTN